ncbi:MAG: hypothetical protein K6F66_01360, partial [Pseudobutyrivibrio sp.]|nr:hypothetical protein [Pseudobutyrivibrio sp.]
PGLRDIMEKEIEDALPVLNEEQLENIKKAFAKTDGKKEMDMFLDIRIMERYLAAHYQDYATFGELYDIIAQYANTVLDWDEYHRQWQENGKNPPMAKEVLLAKGLVQFSQFVDTNVKGAFTSLKGALGNRQLMDEPINQLSKLYGEYQKVLNAKKTDPQKFDEMYNLEEALLAQISELDAAGKSDEAIATYQQLEQILQQTFGVSTLHQ